jgi:hypothetical protein
MVAYDKSGASSKEGWFVILSMVMIGGILATPMLTASTLAQLDNATNSTSNGTMSSNTTGTAATDTNQTIDQVAQQISKNGAEGGAVKQVLTQIATQVDTAGGDRLIPRVAIAAR